MHRFAAALLFASLAIAPAFAQEMSEDAIVVTGARYVDRYQSLVVPHVSLIRRADFATQSLTLTSDSRETATRRNELTEALRGLARLAASGDVSLALLYSDESDDGETRIRPFVLEAALAMLPSGDTGDSTSITVLARTPVSARDTLETVEARFTRFTRAAPKPGRVVIGSGDLELVLNAPTQYRTPLVAEIAADANRIVSALGAGYGARLEGLESPIAWKRAGDLDLRLFVPYRMVVLPRTAMP